MHRTTIVQNKIISIICSCLFFWLANIYRPSLGKVQLGIPNLHSTTLLLPHPIMLLHPTTLLHPITLLHTQLLLLNFYLRKKKHSTQNCMHCKAAHPDFQFQFSFIFKNLFRKIIKKPVKFFNYIYYNY